MRNANGDAYANSDAYGNADDANADEYSDSNPDTGSRLRRELRLGNGTSASDGMDDCSNGIGSTVGDVNDDT
jgi:hypothetical protein